jgi:hypothetical protein
MREAIMPQDAPQPNRSENAALNTRSPNPDVRPDRNPPGFEAVMQEEREAKTETEVRQGITGQGVRYVLGASLTGALVALFVLYAYFTPG